MKRPLFSLLALVCAVTAPSSSAIAQKETATGVEVEKDIALLRRNLRTEKKKVVALNMPLTETEATKFWPVYDAYAADMSKQYDQFYELIKDYASKQKTLTDAQASDLLNLRYEVPPLPYRISARGVASDRSDGIVLPRSS